jgi:LSU ribosomal protein L1P
MKQEILEAVKKAKEDSKPRNFTQSIDVVINIKDLDVKKPENRIDEEVFLPQGRGKDVRIAFIADGELALQAKMPGQIWL